MVHAARGALVAALAVIIATPAAGKPPAPKHPYGIDPKEVVCEKQEVLGSRLQARRVCRTRAEWAEIQRQDRQDLEKRQIRGYKVE